MITGHEEITAKARRYTSVRFEQGWLLLFVEFRVGAYKVGYPLQYVC